VLLRRQGLSSVKIAQGVRALHAGHEELYRRLGVDVEARLRPRVESEKWFFLGRVKQLESFALKLETGRVKDPARFEDFYACTIIVPTAAEINSAQAMIASLYTIYERRPFEDNKTHKVASSFVFDDLRLYVEQPESSSGRDADLDGLLFEVQVKTILQYAWGVATHDLTYKADSVSWPRERIAFQVRAMLEHAELAIAGAHALADEPAIAKSDRSTDNVSEILKVLAEVWSQDQLPTDRKRLAETISAILRMCQVAVNQFGVFVEAEKSRVGLLPTNLSPYAFTIQALANSLTVDFKKLLSSNRNRTSIFVHEDMELPAWMKLNHPRIIRLGDELTGSP
jgi:ppGpp synthetase/RelA/SpoT-type nucleotidyltranferase